MKKQIEDFVRDTLRVDSATTAVSDATLSALMDNTSDEAVEFAQCLGVTDSAEAAEFAKVLATMLAQNQRSSIRHNDESDEYTIAERDGVGIHAASPSSKAIQLDGIGDFTTLESFLGSYDKPMGVGQIVATAINLWKNDGFSKTIVTVPCTTPVVSFHTPVADVRTLAGTNPAVNALEILRNPSLVADSMEKLRLVPTLNPGVFPNEAVEDLAGICDAVGGVATVNHTDVLSARIELRKVYGELTYTNGGTESTQACSISIDNGLFTQKATGSSADRIFANHIPMQLDVTNTADFPTAVVAAGLDPVGATVAPNIIINLDRRSYKPSCAVTFSSVPAGITKVSFEVKGYDILVAMAQDNMRRNIYQISVNAHRSEYHIPQGTQILVDSSITEAGRRGAELVKVATSISRSCVDHNALKAELDTIAIHKRALDTYQANTATQDHPALRYACAGKSLTAIREVALDLAETQFVDHSSQRNAVEGRMVNLITSTIAEAYSEALMHCSLNVGEEIVWTATVSAEVKAACMTFPSYTPDDNGVLNIGGVKLKIFVTSDVEIGERVLIAPRVTGTGENSKILSSGVMADCGAGFYRYQGGDGGAHTNSTAIVDRASFIPTNPTAVIITVSNRKAKAFSPGGNA